MLKRSLLFSIILLLTTQLKAQHFKYGVTANIHKGSIVGIHDYSKAKWGAGLGAFAQWPLVENDIYDSAWLYFSPQVEFSMQGENAEPPQGSQKFSHYYVAMPLYIKYFLHKGNMKRDLFVFAGPRIEYNVYRKKEGAPSYPQFEPQEQKINKFGYGVSFGVGWWAKEDLEIFLRYDRGFSDIYPDYTYRNTYNRLLALGVNFYIGRDY